MVGLTTTLRTPTTWSSLTLTRHKTRQSTEPDSATESKLTYDKLSTFSKKFLEMTAERPALLTDRNKD